MNKVEIEEKVKAFLIEELSESLRRLCSRTTSESTASISSTSW